MTGNDLKQIGQIVTIEGKDYNLIIDINALIDLDDKYKGIGVEGDSGVEKAFNLLLKGDLKTARYFFWLALRHSDDNITEKQAGKILGSSNLLAVIKSLRMAMTESLPDQDSKNVVAPAEET